MSDLQIAIGHFNRAEAMVWFVVALGLPFVIKADAGKQRRAVMAASFGFVLFGFTDLIEASGNGAMPAWLWAFKISCATLLMACRVLYVGRENFRPNDRWLVFGLLCLAASVALMALG